MTRSTEKGLEVLLAFPGGTKPHKERSWGIPKGSVNANEDIFEAAVREFREETGITPQADCYKYLGEIPSPGLGRTHIWTFEGSWSASDGHTSNTFIKESPRGSGKMKEFAEIEEIRWFALDEAREKIKPKQKVFLDRLKNKAETSIVINEDEPYQRAVKKGHRRMKLRLIGLGGNKKKEKGYKEPSYKRSKSAPPGG